jgi:hypothetical protein
MTLKDVAFIFYTVVLASIWFAFGRIYERGRKP